ncbi:hypothetical protein ACPOL_3892 [Acidisarcina polymorpha]|uniref:Uncharacterized protein n=1 Tax=Acidisarcina polymorpha TaxID=2211140 RepID=A0A2Z5G249_9BACT|nr:hypothetical protein ACPOL_3892 [Acidisarcina polymorpha]
MMQEPGIENQCRTDRFSAFKPSITLQKVAELHRVKRHFDPLS